MKKPPVSENMVQARQLSIRGTDAMQNGNWREAEHLFGSAVQTCPVNERARAGYAEALWQKDARREAIAQMEEAVKLSGGDPELLVRLGEMNLASGDLDGAAARADAAIKNRRQLASAWALRGDVERQRGNMEGALQSYHRALGDQESYPRVQIAIAEIYRHQNKPQRALSTLDHLCDVYAPGTVPADVNCLRGMAQKALKRYDDAVESLLAAVKNNPRDADLLFQLGEAQMLSGDRDAARATIQEALALAPQNPNSQRLAAHLQTEQRRNSVAGNPIR